MDAEFKRCLGTVLKSHRVANGLTMQQLCYMCDVNRLTLRKIESGTGNPTLDILLRLSDGLGVSFAQLVMEASEKIGLLGIRAVEDNDCYFIRVV